jgi:hypothetical protein
MPSSDVWVRALLKYYSADDLEAAQRCILQAEASRVQDVVQITSQSSRAGSASGISIPPAERETWLLRIEEALAILSGEPYTRHWSSQSFATRSFET